MSDGFIQEVAQKRSVNCRQAKRVRTIAPPDFTECMVAGSIVPLRIASSLTTAGRGSCKSRKNDSHLVQFHRAGVISRGPKTEAVWGDSIPMPKVYSRSKERQARPYRPRAVVGIQLDLLGKLS